MFPVTITLNSIDELQRVIAALYPTTPAQPAPAAEAPGKPQKDAKATKSTAAATTASPAPSPRTAEAAPSTDAPSPAAPEGKTTDTKPAAAASSAGDAFPYEKLQKKVFELLPTHGAKLLEISVKHGAPKFKELPADKWQAAYDDLVATYEAA